MLNKNELIQVQNRSAGRVIYRIPEDNIRRTFAPGEIKSIPLGELEKLTFQEGGKTLIEDYLLLTNPKATEDLDIATEPEYWLNAQQVEELLVNGSNDELLDALDFAPQGVIDLIKDMAVKIKINDYNKRASIKQKTGFDVTKALELEQQEHEENEVVVHEAPKRRVQPAVSKPEPAKYTVLNKK